VVASRQRGSYFFRKILRRRNLVLVVEDMPDAIWKCLLLECAWRTIGLEGGHDLHRPFAIPRAVPVADEGGIAARQRRRIRGDEM
jgi:hypothetical protein